MNDVPVMFCHVCFFFSFVCICKSLNYCSGNYASTRPFGPIFLVPYFHFLILQMLIIVYIFVLFLLKMEMNKINRIESFYWHWQYIAVRAFLQAVNELHVCVKLKYCKCKLFIYDHKMHHFTFEAKCFITYTLVHILFNVLSGILNVSSTKNINHLACLFTIKMFL